ncbi:MAG: hypothetical protein JKY48_06375 [Flavobacteriales bacterium]|nr:hypothetical protein [Flavobacteriales bacterium]
MGCRKLTYHSKNSGLKLVHSKNGVTSKNSAKNVRRALEYRIHDASIGRFLSRDPLASEFAYNSPYVFSENRVIDGVELEGLEIVQVTQMKDKVSGIKRVISKEVKFGTQRSVMLIHNIPAVLNQETSRLIGIDDTPYTEVIGFRKPTKIDRKPLRTMQLIAPKSAPKGVEDITPPIINGGGGGDPLLDEDFLSSMESPIVGTGALSLDAPPILDEFIKRANNTDGLESISINVQIGNTATVDSKQVGSLRSDIGYNNTSNYLISNGLNKNIKIKKGVVGPVPEGGTTKNSKTAFSIDID